MDKAIEAFAAVGIVTTITIISGIGYLLIMLGWDFIRLSGIITKLYTNTGLFGGWVDWDSFEQDLICLKNRPKR